MGVSGSKSPSASALSAAPSAVHQDDLLVSHSRITLVTETVNGEQRPCQSLGRGTFGSVFKAIFNGRPAAMKKVHLTAWAKIMGVTPSVALSYAVQEIAVQASLNHANVLPAWSYAVDQAPGSSQPLHLFIVQPFRSGGNLATFLQDDWERESRVPGSGSSLTLRLKLLVDVLEGVQYLHSVKGIVHANLKPQNVLLSVPYTAAKAPHHDNCEPPNILLSPLRAELSDCGYSKRQEKGAGSLEMGLSRLSKGPSLDSIELTLKARQQDSSSYLDPQALSEDKSSNRKGADIFALGILAWHTLTRRVPFAGQPVGHQGVLKGRPAITALPSFGGEDIDLLARSLIEGMWSSSEAERPPIEQVLEGFRHLLNSVRLLPLRLPWAEMAPVMRPILDNPDSVHLGKGASGKVYKCKWRGIDCAVKVIKAQAVELNEVIMHSGLVHPNILPLYAYSIDEGTGDMAVLLKIGKCSLEKVVRGKEPLSHTRRGGLELAQRGNTLSRLRVVLQIAEGVEYAHKRGFLHADLKPASE